MNDILDINNDIGEDMTIHENDFRNIFARIKSLLTIKSPLELSVSIISAEHQRELNQQYRDKKYVADVLTFPLETKNELDISTITGIRTLGDIFICYEKAVEQSLMYGHSLRREMAFLFTHGMLHILGYDHQTKTEEQIMFDLQRKVLNDLQIYRIPLE